MIHSNCLFYFYFRHWHQVLGLPLLVHQRAEHLRLHSGDWQGALWARQTWTQPTVSLDCQMWTDNGCRSEAHCQALLQNEIPKCSRLRGCQRFCHWARGPKLHQAEISRHRKVWHHRSGLENAVRTLLQSEKAQREKLWDGDRPRDPVCRVSLPGSSAAQHPRLSHHRRRLPNNQKALQAVHHWTHKPRIFLIQSKWSARWKKQ